jgi:hypothetical protein
VNPDCGKLYAYDEERGRHHSARDVVFAQAENDAEPAETDSHGERSTVLRTCGPTRPSRIASRANSVSLWFAASVASFKRFSTSSLTTKACSPTDSADSRGSRDAPVYLNFQLH